MKKLIGLCLSLCTVALVACGGGGGSSNSSGSESTNSTNNSTNSSSNNTTTNSTITTNCAVTANAGVNTYSVTTQGCILKLKGGDQTALCANSSLKMLSGVGLTAAKIQEQGSSFSAQGLTINGEAIKCL